MGEWFWMDIVIAALLGAAVGYLVRSENVRVRVRFGSSVVRVKRIRTPRMTAYRVYALKRVPGVLLSAGWYSTDRIAWAWLVTVLGIQFEVGHHERGA